jgi:hypothetical protein
MEVRVLFATRLKLLDEAVGGPVHDSINLDLHLFWGQLFLLFLLASLLAKARPIIIRSAGASVDACTVHIESCIENVHLFEAINGSINFEFNHPSAVLVRTLCLIEILDSLSLEVVQ